MVHDEVMRHRFVTSPKARRGEPAPDGLPGTCDRLGRWPRCRNGCKRRGGHGCDRRPKVRYDWGMARRAADAELSEARRGVDESEPEFTQKCALIDDCYGRGLSPERIVNVYPELGISKVTVYEWTDRGYCGLENIRLRRKVAYRPGNHAGGGRRRSAGHSREGSHDGFLKLPEGVRDSAWGTGTVEGTSEDTLCLPTPYHRPSGFQLAIPVASQAVDPVLAGLGLVRDALGGEGAMRRVFGCVLTDNGTEFSDEGALAKMFGEAPDEVKLYYCDPNHAEQKGGCERNHSEIRKLLPKGVGIRFDRLARADCALVMSQVNSEPRGKLAWMAPSRVLRAAFGDDAARLLDALGIEGSLPTSPTSRPPASSGRAPRGATSP